MMLPAPSQKGTAIGTAPPDLQSSRRAVLRTGDYHSDLFGQIKPYTVPVSAVQAKNGRPTSILDPWQTQNSARKVCLIWNL